ncbi:MAG: 6-carboxytetrahydropterin synthase [Thaumarchaeota archaeon]|nr:6-carboxytetrahydropterin synthase [Nitrososphaerota archaeon]MCY3976331.1 6-carboxytetrahydropterin synthase [Nitrososphaerota archaeon]
MDSKDVILDSDFKYIDKKGNIIDTEAQFFIANLLAFLGQEYTYKHNIKLKDDIVKIDFKTKYGLVEIIDNDEDELKIKKIKKETPDLKIISIGNKNYKVNMVNFTNSNENTKYVGSIFIDEPSLSFDYAHILPLVKKCSILHGHTSSVFIELTGKMKNNMLIDFTDAKKIAKNAISKLDHKFFINKKYLQKSDDLHYRITFNGPQGVFDLHVPKNTTYLLDGEATVENLSSEIIKILVPMLPTNIDTIGVYIYEGYNKGAHIISHILK